MCSPSCRLFEYHIFLKVYKHNCEWLWGRIKIYSQSVSWGIPLSQDDLKKTYFSIPQSHITSEVTYSMLVLILLAYCKMSLISHEGHPLPQTSSVSSPPTSNDNSILYLKHPDYGSCQITQPLAQAEAQPLQPLAVKRRTAVPHYHVPPLSFSCRQAVIQSSCVIHLRFMQVKMRAVATGAFGLAGHHTGWWRNRIFPGRVTCSSSIWGMATGPNLPSAWLQSLCIVLNSLFCHQLHFQGSRVRGDTSMISL